MSAAGHGAIQNAPPPEAAGQGAHVDYTAEQAANDIRDDTSLAEIVAIVKRVEPRPDWYISDHILQANLLTQSVVSVRPAVRQWLRDGYISRLRVPVPPMQVNLRGGRRRKTRKPKRKHFRKRTSRKH